MHFAEDVHRRNQKNATVMTGPMSTRIGSMLKNVVIPTVHSTIVRGKKFWTNKMIPPEYMETGRKSRDKKLNVTETAVNQINAMSP